MRWRKPIGVIRGPRGEERTIEARNYRQSTRLKEVRSACVDECLRLQSRIVVAERSAHKAASEASEAKAKLLELSPFLADVREVMSRSRFGTYALKMTFDPRACALSYFDRGGFRAQEDLARMVADLASDQARACMMKWQQENLPSRGW